MPLQEDSDTILINSPMFLEYRVSVENGTLLHKAFNGFKTKCFHTSKCHILTKEMGKRKEIIQFGSCETFNLDQNGVFCFAVFLLGTKLKT